MNPILKYNLKDHGLKLEKTNPQEAIKYYNNLLNHEYFINDYYIYRRLVLMFEKTRDSDEKIRIIKKFFKSGIYCNNHHYLWFIHKLEKLNINQDEINKLTSYFKKNSIPNKNKSNTPLPVADRIRKRNGEVIVESQEKYNRREKQYEYEIKLTRLNYQHKYHESIDLLNYMIEKEGYKRYIYFKKLCLNYSKIKDKENELKTIKRYFNGESTRTRKSDKWFENRLNILNETEIIININDLDLTKNPFYEYNKKLDLKENLKRKATLIEYGKTLNFNDAINYYKYLCNNTYFKNDYYPYRQLTIIYDELNDYTGNLVNIKKLLQSRIYLNEYQFLYFSDKIRVLMNKTGTDDETVKKWFDDYEIHGSVNKFKLNKYLADKFQNKDGMISIISDDEYNYAQELLALKEKGCIYERVGNFELAIIHYIKIIKDLEFNYVVFHKRLCYCLGRINDMYRLDKAIELYFTYPPIDKSESSDEYFMELKPM